MDRAGEGGEAINFTNDPGTNYHPDWSPLGGEIAFISERDGVAHVWVAPVRGGAPVGPARRLTDGPSSHMAPSWSPDASMVAYVAVDDQTRAEAWVVSANGGSAPLKVTQGARASRVGWAGPGRLVVAGSWGTSRLILTEVDTATGESRP